MPTFTLNEIDLLIAGVEEIRSKPASANHPTPEHDALMARLHDARFHALPPVEPDGLSHYTVEIEQTITYNVEVEAPDEDTALDMATVLFDEHTPNGAYDIFRGSVTSQRIVKGWLNKPPG